MKGVAQEQGRAEIRGMIEICEEGRKTDTHLTQDVLMLDPSAVVDATPALEIRTSDVKASHSATISRVTPEDLFYLRSRGISEEGARRMFIDGFLLQMMERVQDTSLRHRLMAIAESEMLSSSAPSPQRPRK